MEILKYFISFAILFGSIQNVFGSKIWDIALLDISSDMDAYAKTGLNEMKVADTCLKHLIKNGMIDSVMFFAGGRFIMPEKDISESNRDYSIMRKIIGDGTSIYDALASCMELPHKESRILVISNGRETESSLSSATLSKLLESKGIRIDAVVVSAGSDSIYLKSSWLNSTDSTLYERNHVNSGLKHIVDRTGGEIITIEGTSEINEKITSLRSVAAKHNVKPSKKKSNLNEDLTRKALAQIKRQKIYICEVDTNAVITHRGFKYHGLNEVLKLANLENYILISQNTNNNSGNKYPLNVVFALNQNDMKRKRLILNQLCSDNFECKLTQETPVDVLPMIYYSGSGGKMLICGIDFEEAE